MEIGLEKDGFFNFNASAGIEGKTRKYVNYKLQLKIIETDPNIFIKKLGNSSGYKITINYKTKRIGGFSKSRKFLIVGDYEEYKNKLIDEWSMHNLTDMVLKLKILNRFSDNPSS